MGLRLGLECEGQEIASSQCFICTLQRGLQVEHLYLVILFVFLFFVWKESVEVWLKSFLSFPGRKMLNPIMLCVITLIRVFCFFFNLAETELNQNSRVFQEHLLLWSFANGLLLAERSPTLDVSFLASMEDIKIQTFCMLENLFRKYLWLWPFSCSFTYIKYNRLYESSPVSGRYRRITALSLMIP